MESLWNTNHPYGASLTFEPDSDEKISDVQLMGILGENTREFAWRRDVNYCGRIVVAVAGYFQQIPMTIPPIPLILFAM